VPPLQKPPREKKKDTKNKRRLENIQKKKKAKAVNDRKGRRGKSAYYPKGKSNYHLVQKSRLGMRRKKGKA